MNGHNHSRRLSSGGQPESNSSRWSPFPSLTRSASRRKKPNMPLAPADADDPTGNGIVDTIEAIMKNGSPLTLGSLPAVWDAFQNQNGIGIDDRKFLLEEILMFLSRLPSGSQLGTKVEHYLIDFFQAHKLAVYKDLPHPPSTFLSPMVYNATSVGPQGFAYRTADGSHNNPLLPHLGAAHQPYARSVAASRSTPSASLPDPGLTFDTLLRRNKDVDHPTGLSSMFFAFANLIIHSLFRTRPTAPTINDTSSYLDLSPLYGVDSEEQNTVRKKDGSGCLWEDSFADKRLLGMAPPVCALLVIFSRNHNFVAKRIRQINERKNYDRPNMNDEGLQKQDEEIFQRARLVNCGAFMQVIMRDYVSCILHMIPDLTPWHLKPLEEIRGSDHEIAPRGEGNVCSVEFNLLYRWHATTSAKDAKWLHELMKEITRKEPEQITDPREFYQAVGALMSRAGGEPKKWTFGDLKRTGSDGSGPFNDSDLAKVLQSASADMAQAFRARGIPAAFRIIEIMGIQQARDWGVCSLNEFRKFLGLKPYSKFSEWNPDPEISTAAERLYHHIDNLELYVGMQAEEARPSRPGSGLASGYTMSRSILADAVALIRGDRFLTIEYTPFNLTSWGFQDVETTDDNGSLGGMLPKLLFRTLPNHYVPKNIFSHFPFIVPSRMQEFLKKDEKKLSQYDFNPPLPRDAIQPIQDYDVIKGILSDTANFLGPYESFAMIHSDSQGFYFGGAETQSNKRNRKLVEETLFTTSAIHQHATYYYEKTLELIADKSYSPVGASHKVVDIVREVINYTPLHWIVSHVVDLPLQTTENPDGKYKEEELYGFLAVLFSYVYLNSEPVNSWFLELHSGRAAKILLQDIREKAKSVSIPRLRNVFNKFLGDENAPARKTVLQELSAANNHDGNDENEIISNILGIIINCAANWSKAMTHVIDFYLDEERHVERDDIVQSIAYGAQAEDKLIGYVREALRLNPPVAGVLREKQGRGAVNVSGVNFNHNERVYLNLASALKDTTHLEDAVTVRPQRGRVEPFSFVPGAHSSLSQDFSERTMAQVLRAVFSKKNLRRGPGASGRLAKFIDDFHGTSQPMYIDSNGAATPWPKSLILQYDI